MISSQSTRVKRCQGIEEEEEVRGLSLILQKMNIQKRLSFNADHLLGWQLIQEVSENKVKSSRKHLSIDPSISKTRSSTRSFFRMRITRTYLSLLAYLNGSHIELGLK